MTVQNAAKASAPPQSDGGNSVRFANAPNVILSPKDSRFVGDNDLRTEGPAADVMRGAPISKRALDIFGSAVLLVFFAPLMIVLFFLVRMDGGPAMFIHQRVGKNGVLFRCYKFRSMIPNAEEVLKDILVCDSQFRNDWEADQKLRNDPRITRIGVFLRHKSLDELPQLLNVLKGDMSLVGPRPITVDEISRYGPAIEYYYRARPGLTGAWQISGRNDVSYEERVALDVAYSRRWSFLTDLAILFKTIGVVISGRGAL
jgi:undecaprenyl-phosphate galactose phosphotransferase